jgi:hypothetical protein
VKEIEEALLSRRVDIAVHRAKDMPSDDLASLEVAAALPREDARDALILPGGAGTIPFAVASNGCRPTRHWDRKGSDRRERRAQRATDRAAPRSLTDYDAVEPQVPGLASREGDD